MYAIEIEKFSKKYRDGLLGRTIEAVKDLSLTVNKGEVFGFVGPNGAGKSTTIKTLLNFVYPDAGSLTIFGHDVRDCGVRSFTGYLPENPCYYKSLSADELLRFGAATAGFDKADTKDRIRLLLDKVQLSDAAKRPIKTYSKGMVQRVGIALALIHDPQLVILDEPMSGLDPLGRKLVGDLILEMKQQGKTVFFSSHILNDAERFCDRVAIIAKGQLRRVDTMQGLLSEFSDLESAFLATIAQVER